jgi:hypothetical protein
MQYLIYLLPVKTRKLAFAISYVAFQSLDKQDPLFVANIDMVKERLELNHPAATLFCNSEDI